MIFGEGPIIKNIAGDLNKLFLQGTRAGQPINNVEGDAAADQGTIQLMADRDPVIRDISTGLGWAGREVTVSGTGALQLVNSLGRPLKSWSVELAPKQDLNGYDSPWPAAGGANKWDEEWEVGLIDAGNGNNTANTNYSRTKNYVPLVDGESYYLCPVSKVLYLRYYDANKAYLGYKQYAAGGNRIVVGGTTNFTPVAEGNAAYIRFCWDGNTYNNDIAVNYPSSVTTYSPYSNICPIYGTDKLNMFVEEAYDPSATPKAVITLPQTIYNGMVSDDGAVSSWGEVDLGTLDWTYNSGTGRFSTNGIRNTAKYVYGQNNYNLMCSIYNPSATGDYCAWIGWAGDLNIINSQITSASDFKTAMSGVILYYELATPTILTLSTPTIPTTDGNGTIWVTAEDGIVTNFSATYLQSE